MLSFRGTASRRLCAGLSAFALTLLGCAGGSSNSGSSAPVTTPVTTPAATPVIASVSPTNVPVGTADTTLTVTGSGFVSGSVVFVNSIAETTTYTSATQLQAVVPAAQLKTGAVLAISVNNNNGTVAAKADPSVTALSVDNPVPSLVSVAPAVVLLGSLDTTVTVTGTNFVPGVALSVNGTPRATTYVSATQLTAQVSAADLTAAGSLPLNIINPKPGGGTSGTSVLSVNNPAPVIASLSPASIVAGASDTVVTITGTGFLASTALQVNGANHAATTVSGTQIAFTLTAAEIAAAKALQVTLTNPLPGGGTSTAGTFTVQNPAPTLASVSPSTLTVGSGPTTLTLTGTGFLQGSTVTVNGSARTSQFISATGLSVTLNASDIAAAAPLAVTVANPQPGGGNASIQVAVNNPAPSIASLTPSTIARGSTDTVVTLSGSGFLPSTTLQLNGNAHAVTYVNSSVLSVTLLTSELATSVSYALTATNPAPVGGTSAPVILTVGSGSPIITNLSPNALPVGSAATNVTITGTGFVPSSQVLLGGYPHSGVTYVSSTQLTLPLTASDLNYSGAYSVVVSNPSTAGGVSSSATFTVQARTPVISSLSPSSLITNSGSTTLVIYGINLTASSKAYWNATQLTATYQLTYNPATSTYVSALIATVPADLLSTTGTANITVTTPTAAANSNAVSLTITDPPVPTVTSVSPSAVPVNTQTSLSIYGTGFTKTSVVNYNGTPLTTTFNNTLSLSATVPATMLALPGNGSITVITPAPGGGTSTAAALTVYVPIVSNSMVYNPVNGLAYLSIPSTGSTVTGNSIVSIDPATGALGTPIYVGSEPGVMAISDDGRTLWVALNGLTAIRKVDLVNAVAGAQYSVASVSINNSSNTLTSMIVLPGSTNSVAVTNGSYLGIYDSGVLRGNPSNVSSAYALQADGTRNELYAGGNYGVQSFNYTSTALTARSTNNNYNPITSSTYDEMQLASGKMFTDFGKVYDPESSSLLGTFTQGTTTITGPTLYDTNLSQVYVLNSGTGNAYGGYTQVALFNPSDYSNTGKTIGWNIPSSINSASASNIYLNPHRLTRWGANGLMVHTKAAIFTMQSNTIHDQSSLSADLAVTLASSGGSTTGTTTTYTATITNSGPQAATDVAVALQTPATGVLTGTTASVGACSSLSGCTLGTLAANTSATVTITVLQITSGTGSLTATASASSTDPTSTNNSATASVTVTGSTYNLQPTVVAISPTAIKMGSQDTTLTVTGTNFASGSTVMLGSTALATTLVNSATLTATVPASSLAALGWSAVSVSTPTPGGGSSGSLPLTIYNVIAVGLNHILYEPYSRNLYASISTGSSSITANSVVSLDPTTGTFGTPFTFSTAPNLLALSSTGNTLYTDIAFPSGANNSFINSFSMGRLNLAAATADNITAQVSSSFYPSSTYPLLGLAVLPGSENTVALGRTTYSPPVLNDYNAASKTLSQRGSANSNYYSASCLGFLDSSNLITFGSGSGVLDYLVTSTGLGNPTTLSGASVGSCLRLAGNTAVSSVGQVYNINATSVTQTGSVVLPNVYYYNSSSVLPAVALDTGLQSVFYPANTISSYYSNIDGILSYSLGNYLRTGSISLSIPTIEGTSSSSTTITDLIRWGQDGLALTTSTGHIYLLRGPFVVPQELSTGTAATLTGNSAATLTHGTGNTLLTLTGTNFQPGVAVTWNGSYRTTTLVDSTHVTVAVPATDLTTAGSASLVATNPGAIASSTLTVTVQ